MENSTWVELADVGAGIGISHQTECFFLWQYARGRKASGSGKCIVNTLCIL